MLYSLVVKGLRGDVQTDICSESQLRRKAEEFRCKLDFDAMTLYLAENDHVYFGSITVGIKFSSLLLRPGAPAGSR